MHGVEAKRESAAGQEPRGPRRCGSGVSACATRGLGDELCPKAGEEFFSKDDVDWLAGIIDKASQAQEWGQVAEGLADPEQGRGLA